MLDASSNVQLKFREDTMIIESVQHIVQNSSATKIQTGPPNDGYLFIDIFDAGDWCGQEFPWDCKGLPRPSPNFGIGKEGRWGLFGRRQHSFR